MDSSAASAVRFPPRFQRPSHDALAALPESVDNHRVFLPTVEQILAECQRIRDGWSRAEQHRRRAGVTESDYVEQ